MVAVAVVTAGWASFPSAPKLGEHWPVERIEESLTRECVVFIDLRGFYYEDTVCW